MSEGEPQPASMTAEKMAELSEKIDAFLNWADPAMAALRLMQETSQQNLQAIQTVREDLLPVVHVLPIVQKLATDLDRLRVVALGKLDGLQGTVDLVRQDVRNSWSTADFAITNSRHVREETDKVLSLISTMQRQQQLLTSQVDELRKAAAEKEAGN